jgi:hypothetical protein
MRVFIDSTLDYCRLRGAKQAAEEVGYIYAPPIRMPGFLRAYGKVSARIRIPRSRIDCNCIVPNPAEKAELLRPGALLDHDVSEVMHVVRLETYRKWVRQARQGIAFKRPGRLRTSSMAKVNLVLRMAEENVCWGNCRIIGEL